MRRLSFTNRVSRVLGCVLGCCLLLSLTRAHAQVGANRDELFVDDTLGGLRIGDHIDRARLLYPSLRSVDKYGGYEVSIGADCLLTINTRTEGPQLGRIFMLFLDVFDPKQLPHNSDCANLRTAKGFLIGQSLSVAEAIYRSPASNAGGGSLTINSDNGPECESGKTKVMKSMIIAWSSDAHLIKYYMVEASEESCNDYIAGRQSEVDQK